MLRLILTLLLPLLLPVLAYYILQLAAPKNKDPDKPNRLDHGGLFWSLAVGAVLAIISVLAFGLQEKTPVNRIYVPAKMEDGVLIPGKFIEKPASPAPAAPIEKND